MMARFFVCALGLFSIAWGCGSGEPGVTAGAGAAGSPTNGEAAGGAGGEAAVGAAGEAAAGEAGASGGSGAPPALISVEDGGFQAGEAPEQSGSESLPSIVSLTGPVAVTNGGSAVLRVQLSEPLAAPMFLVSLVGDTGYHDLTGVDPDGDGIYEISVHVSGEADQVSLLLRVALTDGMGRVGEYEQLEVELVHSGEGDVKITLSFDRVHDLDLHVIEPNGEEISYQNNASRTGGELDLDSGERCMPSAANSENIFWPPGGAPSGEYRVSVHNYEHCTPGEIPFTVRVAHDGSIAIHHGSFADGTAGEVFEVATFTR